MRGEIITWSPQKHVHCKHTIGQERSQRWADRVLSGLTGLESLDNIQVKHARGFVVGLRVGTCKQCITLALAKTVKLAKSCLATERACKQKVTDLMTLESSMVHRLRYGTILCQLLSAGYRIAYSFRLGYCEDRLPSALRAHMR